MSVDTHVDLVDSLNLPRWSGDYGSKFIGIVVGVLNDMLTDGASIALLAQFSTIPEFQPLDAVDLLGNDCMRPHYTGETYDSARARILGKWDFWTGDPKQGLLDELTAAGYPNAEIILPAVPDPDDYWSRFWIRIPFGSHPVTSGTGFIVGTDVVGVKRIGPQGIDSETGERYYRLLTAICKRYKPMQWVVWDFEFENTPGNFIRLQGKKRFKDAAYVYDGP